MGQRWFETGCVSAHFKTMVVKGEDVTASLTALGESVGRIEAVKADGSPVLAGTASVEPHGETEISVPAGEGGLPR